MSLPDSPLLFLGMVAIISLSGVMMPGPVFAATVVKGYSDLRAGIKIAAGHAMIELPLIAAIFLGFGTVLNNEAVFAAVGIIGGALLFYMGLELVRKRERMVMEENAAPYNSFTAGLLMTAVNPYFFLWWATVGAAMIAVAVQFGLIMLPIFAIVHISCDFAWNQFVSMTVFKSRGLWSERKHKYLFVVSGAIMLFFAVYFIASSLLGLI